MECTIRPLQRHEVGIVTDFAAAEDWNPGPHDAACFHAADPGGFLVAEHGDEPIGCISAVSYAGRFGFIGLYIVVPAWRGQGIGSRLWAAGMDRLAGHVVGLDGVPAQQAYYGRKGFALAWRNARFAGAARPAPAHVPPQIVPLRNASLDALCADDRRNFPAPRDAFLRGWITMPEAAGLAWIDDGRLLGWGLIRHCRSGHKIAPLVADAPHIALALYDALCAQVPPGDTVYVDVPTPNADAIELTRARGLQTVFETARMYAGPAPRIELQRLYGLTSFELG
jgi:GNAT superfamily N-acetyltransferase